jgi:hypothetical protein
MTSPAQPGIGDAYKLHHVMGHDRQKPLFLLQVDYKSVCYLG